MSLYYKRDGTPYPPGDQGLFEWARDFEKPRHVGCDVLPNGIEISTVWLGIDHNWMGDNHRPLIFESMVFVNGRGGDFDVFRYSTEEEALRGHKMLVKKWSAIKNINQIIEGGSNERGTKGNPRE